MLGLHLAGLRLGRSGFVRSGKFKGEHQPVAAPHIADDRVFRLERGDPVPQLLAPCSGVDGDVQALRLGQAGDGSGGPDRVAGIGVAVEQFDHAFGAVHERVVHLVRGQHRAHRNAAVAQALGGGDQIRRDAEALRGEGVADGEGGEGKKEWQAHENGGC